MRGNFFDNSYSAMSTNLHEENCVENAIIIDIGTFSVKVYTTFSNEDERFWKQISPYVVSGNLYICGNDAFEVARTDGKDIRCILEKNSLFGDLRILKNFLTSVLKKSAYQERAIFVAEPLPDRDLDNHRAQRKNLARLFLHEYNPLGYFVAPQPLLAMYNLLGRTDSNFRALNGVVVDIGHSQTKVAVIYHGNTLPMCTTTSDIAGKLFDELLLKQMSAKVSVKRRDKFLIPAIKQEHLFVVQSYQKLLAKLDDADFIQSVRVDHQLEDGTLFTLDEERFKIPEVLFNPEVMACGFSNDSSLPTLIRDSRAKYDQFRSAQFDRNNFEFQHDDANSLFNKFFIIGGSTKMPGMIERVQTEVKLLMIEHEADSFFKSFGRLCEREDLDEIARRVTNTLEFRFERNPGKRGMEAGEGALSFINNSCNEVWLSPLQLYENEQELVLEKCPR